MEIRKIPKSTFSLCIFGNFLCIFEFWLSKGRWMRKTLKFWEKHFFIDWNDISLGQMFLQTFLQIGTPYYPYLFIPIPLSLSLYPYLCIPIPLSLSLYPYPFIPTLYPYPFIPIPLFYPFTGCPKKNAVKICVWKNDHSLLPVPEINLDQKAEAFYNFFFWGGLFSGPNWLDQQEAR